MRSSMASQVVHPPQPRSVLGAMDAAPTDKLDAY
jgi:hypothetical protein